MDEEKDKKDFIDPQEESVEPDPTIRIRRKELYEKKDAKEFSKRFSELEHMTPKPLSSHTDAVQPELVDVMQTRILRRQKVFQWIGIGALVVSVFTIAVVATIFYRRSRQVVPEHIVFGIEAPTEFTAGEYISYRVKYRNESRIAWNNVELLFVPPSGFRYRSSDVTVDASAKNYVISVGTLPAGEEKTSTISGQLIGEKRRSAIARAEIAISPENFPKARFQKETAASTTFVSVPVEVSAEISNNAAPGERIVGTIKVRNSSSVPLSGVLLQVIPTNGLQVAPEDASFSSGYIVADSWWELPSLEPSDEVSRIAVFSLEGRPGERRIVQIKGIIREKEELFVQREVDHVVTVTAAELSIRQTMNNSEEPFVIKPGESIEGAVHYKNVGTVGLKNAIVSTSFSGTGFDPSALILGKSGSYNPHSRSVSWTAASVPGLATLLPQEEGTISYSLRVLSAESFKADASSQNQSLVITATIDSPDLPTPTGQERRVTTNRFLLPIGTDLSLAINALYDDGRLGITSSGPLPPQVGQETTYTLRMRLGSSFNDVGNVLLKGGVPDGVRFTQALYKTDGDIQFNERTGEFTWTLPIVKGLAGKALPPHELHIQVGITPGENLLGDSVALLRYISAEGTEIFTDETVKASRNKDLPSTETAVLGKGEVQP